MTKISIPKHYLYKYFKVPFTKNKNVELELFYLKDYHWFGAEFLKRKHDHAGFELTLMAFNRWFNISFYDSRHWDYEKNTWCNKETI